MAISLNNHETRIKALENSSVNGLLVTDIKIAENGWIWFSNGLQICWGWNSGYRYSKPFTNACLLVIAVPGGNGNNNLYDLNITSKSKTGFSTRYSLGSPIRHFAIGYLISDRILKYAYACKSLLFTPLRKIGGVK